MQPHLGGATSCVEGMGLLDYYVVLWLVTVLLGLDRMVNHEVVSSHHTHARPGENTQQQPANSAHSLPPEA